MERLSRAFTAAFLTAFSAIAEKNPIKSLSNTAPITLSAGRIVRLWVAAVWGSVVLRDGVTGWPAATLGALVVFAPEIAEALRRVAPGNVVDFAKTLAARFGVGGNPAMGRGLYSIYDDDIGGEPGTIDPSDLEPPAGRSRPGVD